jgi:hypothetical protein
MRGVSVESESEELSTRHGGGGDGEGLNVGKDDNGEVLWALELWGFGRCARLHVVRGTVLEGWRDSLGGFLHLRSGVQGKRMTLILLSRHRLYTFCVSLQWGSGWSFGVR